MKNLILGAAVAATLLSCEPIEINTTDAICLRYEAWTNNVEVASGEINAITLSQKNNLVDSIGVHYNADSVWAETFFCIEQQGLPSGGIKTFRLDLMSVYTAGWAGGVSETSNFDSIGVFKFDYDNGYLYTMNATADTIKPLPVMGFIWEQEFKFAFDNQDSVVQIHTETWEYKLCDGKHTLTRFTNYYGMGTDVQTLILTEL